MSWIACGEEIPAKEDEPTDGVYKVLADCRKVIGGGNKMGVIGQTWNLRVVLVKSFFLLRLAWPLTVVAVEP